MPEITLSVEVDADVDATWAAATDWARQGEWMAGTTVVPTRGRGSARGDELEARTALGPFGFVDRMVITSWEPPRRALVAHVGRVVRGSGAFEVEPLPGGRSRFVWSEWLELPFGRVGELGFALVRPLVVAPIRWSLGRFARWVPQRTA